MSSNPPTIFLSYSHKDERLKERLETHLSVLRGRLDVWDDRRLKAGDDWHAEIEGAIQSADVAVMLISADFLSSDFISSEEVPRLLTRRQENGVTIVPVLLKGCAWTEVSWLSAMQIRPTDARPLMALRGNAREDALAAIATEILKLAEEGTRPASVPKPDPSYPDAPSKELAEALEAAYQQHEDLVSTGGDASATQETILDLKRRLRQEGQLKPGDFLADGRYRLLEILGRGGFSVVFKAYDKQSRGLVAVKVLHAQYAQDKTRRDRFFRGARKMGELQHQAIVRVIEPEAQDEGYHYFVMEYVEGGDLRQAVKAGRISGVDGLALLGEVAEALDLAHRGGVIHRDVKPANILLTGDGKAKLTDFDLVRVLDTTAGTRTGSMLGTFLYMAPEAMMAAENADVAADVYSLGMCAAFVLHGKEIPATFLRHADSFFSSLTAPEGVKQVLRRATAWEPADRIGSVKEFCEELSGALAPGQGDDPPNAPESDWGSRSGRDNDGDWASFEVGGVEQRLRWIPPGEFTMGSPPSEMGRYANEGPAHQVTLTRGFWLAETPCTQALWQAVMGANANPSRFKSPQRPVERVSWEDSQRFIQRLNKRVPGLESRLPSEAEWEYACRADTGESTWKGDLEIVDGKSAVLDSIAWYRGNTGTSVDRRTREVGQKEPNPWGLYDMLGNVREWCRDGRRQYASASAIDPEGPLEGSSRIVHGGSWSDNARYVRAAYRYGFEPGYLYFNLGFRLSRGPERGA